MLSALRHDLVPALPGLVQWRSAALEGPARVAVAGQPRRWSAVMSISYTIDCDGCGCVIDASMFSAAAARRLIWEAGGRVNLPGGKDLCADCAIRGRKPE